MKLGRRLILAVAVVLAGTALAAPSAVANVATTR
jgi:hypothetical protein